MRAPSTNPLRCPACGYDVTTTLRDTIHVCPECGEAISVRACAPRGFDLEPLRALAWRFRWIFAYGFGAGFLHALAPSRALDDLSWWLGGGLYFASPLLLLTLAFRYARHDRRRYGWPEMCGNAVALVAFGMLAIVASSLCLRVVLGWFA